MVVTYIHLSDIHFGQERGAAIYVHEDVKAQLIDDVRHVVKTLPENCVQGIIISGDIAFSAKSNEYHDANEWLTELAEVAGCPLLAIQVVPGNHDVDRADARSHLTGRVLTDIADKGEDELHLVLANPSNRDLFYARFHQYQEFAAAFGCQLETNGGRAGSREVDLVAGGKRKLRFIGLNSALICGALEKEEGKLLLGAGQRVIPHEDGVEVVLIAHHPLKWLQDSEDARKYVRARARVLITGHEHNPSAWVDPVDAGCDVLMLEAGATVPPAGEDGYTYTYNFLQFSWNEPTDGLQVKVLPRVWSDEQKKFCEDATRASDEKSRFTLGCPNFVQGERVVVHSNDSPATELPVVREILSIHAPEGQSDADMQTVTEQYAKLRLRFFRDLNSAERIAVLVELGALPRGWQWALAHSTEMRVLEKLLVEGKLQDLENAVDRASVKKT